jgi:hypothetical protein
VLGGRDVGHCDRLGDGGGAGRAALAGVVVGRKGRLRGDRCASAASRSRRPDR